MNVTEIKSNVLREVFFRFRAMYCKDGELEKAAIKAD